MYKANYQITPRKVTVQANDQKLTLKQAKESLYKNDYTGPSDEVFNQDLANRRLNVAVAYDSSVQPQNFKAGETYPKILVPNVSGQALKNYEVTKINGDVTIGRTQVKLADGQHVYDGKSARYTQSPITLVYTDDKGEEQVLDYTFELSDLQFFFNQQPTVAVHVDEYQVVLSEKGKEKITKMYQEKQLELPDLDVVAKYTITPRALTITALDQNVTKSQLLEGTIDTQKYEISDELFQKEVQESVKEDAKNGVSVQLNPSN
ncbi:MBG domain-containing protein [Enterococcus cecorum]